MSKTSKKEQIHKQLLEDLQKGENENLESEVAYAKKFGVSRTVVRRVVDELVKEGLILRIPGVGLRRNTPGDVARQQAAAPAGKAQKKHILLLITHSPDDDVFNKILHSVITELNNHFCSYMVCNISNTYNRYLQVCNILSTTKFSGAILTTDNTLGNYKLIEEFDRIQLPYVFVDNQMEGIGARVVKSDDYCAGYKAAKLLMSLGHKKILHITSTYPACSLKQRAEGFLNALRDNGRPVENVIVCEAFDPPSWENWVREQCVNGRFPYTGVFIRDDIPACRFIMALKKCGVSVPEDVSVIGFGDYKLGRMLERPLTTLQINSTEMGKQAVNLLLNSDQKDERVILLNTELIFRETTDSPPDR